MTSFGGWR
ncbi:Hypothetical protein PFREUD_01020 [Propionibacterium freudenreichii subsp. shermanii CIRM-BIA1]|uniref:Uncharacterized protein n=1 Tax=Propionibacterium freudenreichii subsp. shermanii (strain ATCC 9614 / DSM 4902 / CIP 103027 / NCIMB 8099 / CIRM-BIA1) TaxID=754252 RepID=D7GHN7_PROFC|nr:Hypothetical protein PFREUD_01020 [Propionibacterium freudenreichii subsp. shermanii CIRM-BIA1]